MPDMRTHPWVTRSMIGSRVRSAQLDALEQPRSSSSSTEPASGHSCTLLHPANDLDDPMFLSAVPATNNPSSHLHHSVDIINSQYAELYLTHGDESSTY